MGPDSQSKVHVTLVAQARYDDTWEKYEAGLANGQRPDAFQLEDIRTQAAIDTQASGTGMGQRQGSS
jgi:hypothetical protein